MALNKPQLATDIENLLASLYNGSANITDAQARTAFAGGLADAIEAFVKSGAGQYQAGTLTSPSGPVTAAGSAPVVKIV